MMDVGTFSLTVFTAYLGLLLDEDFRAIRHVLNRHITEPAIVLFDGRCGFCNKSVFMLSMLDWLHRLKFANFHDPDLKKRYAKDISPAALDAAMHVRLADQSYRKGFFAFRSLCWHIPALWITAPFLYIPGVSIIGSAAYVWVANHR
jgi:predicted DCC family thiol-disulfide oxidoreductase YuxK